MSEAALEFRNVSVRHAPDAPPTLAELTFAVSAGERVALVGLNGSGKTTLLMTAVGLIPYQGDVRVDGETLSPRTLARIRDRVGFLFNVPEDQLLFPKVIDDVAFGPRRRGLSRDAAAAQAGRTLEALGVAHLAESSLHHLSHGQKQRVALAGALAVDPPVLLLDEPSAALDPPGRRALAAVLSTLPAAMIIATHDLDFAASLFTRVLMLAGGRLVFDGRDLHEARRRFDL